VSLLSELLVVQAPMAGGPSTPAMTAAASDAGGFGFLAAGYLSAESLRKAIETTRTMTGAPFGVNVFVPSAPGDPAQVAAYAAALQPEAERLGVTLGEARWEDDAYDDKLDVVESTHVHLVSFTFGCPASEIVERLHRADIQVAVTVTSVLEAQLAADAGTDLLTVQGTEAGGHQGSFADLAANHRTLLTLLEEIRETTDVPMIGTGGVMTGRDAAAVLGAERSPSSWAPRCFVLRKREPLPPTGRRCWMRAIPTRSSRVPTADALPVGWRTGSRSSTTGRPRRRTQRCITSPARFAPPPQRPATPACPTSGPVPAGSR